MAKARRLQRHRVMAAMTAAAAVGLAPSPAAAAVYEVGNDGSVRLCALTDAGQTSCASGMQSDAAEIELAPEVPAAAVTLVAEPNVPPNYRAQLIDVSRRYNVSPRLLAALTGRESAWRASAVSPKGAIGLTQLMPATARALAVDPRDPAANLAGGAHYLRQLLDQFDGDIERALAAYNAGPGRVIRAGGIPPIRETQAYVANIVDRLETAANDGRR